MIEYREKEKGRYHVARRGAERKLAIPGRKGQIYANV